MRTLAGITALILLTLAAWFLVGYGYGALSTDRWYATHEVVIDGANSSFQNYPVMDTPADHFWQRVEKE